MSLYKMEILEPVIIDKNGRVHPATDPNCEDFYFMVEVTHLDGLDKWLSKYYVLRNDVAYLLQNPDNYDDTKPHILTTWLSGYYQSESKTELLAALNVALTSDDFTAVFECNRPKGA